MLYVLLILVVPVIVYGVFELNSLTKDEQELERIYERQLESVLFTINEHLQDKVSEVTTPLENWQSIVSAFESLKQYQFFRALYVEGIGNDYEQLASNRDHLSTIQFASQAKALVRDNAALISRLVRYKESSGFSKVEKGDENITRYAEDLDYFFLVIGTEGNYRVCLYFFNSVEFIEQTLVSKFQELAREDFILRCRKVNGGTLVYSTSLDMGGSVKSEPLDLLDNYTVEIARAGGTIADAVFKRKNQNLLALGLLLVVMLIGVLLVFRNTQKEMQLAQQKADFVSNVSHEIRTPLALINMFAETLSMDRVKSEEKKKEYYEIISKEVSRLLNLTNRILSFSKIEANKRIFDKADVNLNYLVNDVVNMYSYHLESNGFELEKEISEEQLVISADSEAIQEVLVNLIDNAMKYSDSERYIKIETGGDDNRVFVSVTDHGIGIPKDQQEKLFDKFYRVSTGDVHDTKGSGLGLTIVKHIIEAHEGTIDVKSTPGKGSTFRLNFKRIEHNG